MDTLDTVELVQKTIDRAPATGAPRKEVFVKGLVRARREWSSSLDQRSLQCLLAILETSVIPQLIGEYSPAATAPLSLRDPAA